MKFLTFVLLFFLCVLAAHLFDGLKTHILRPVLTRFHIPAPRFTLNEIIAAAARKHQVSPAFVMSIIEAESGFSQAVVSPKGAVGLMQLMPETAREFGADPSIPEQNIDAGAHYLSWLLQRYKGKRDALRRTIAAYNAGPGAVERYRGVPPFRETRTYVTRVLRFYKKYEPEYELAALRLSRNRPNKSLG
ncbi:MAG TPA: lytic transglycosylase domain-containing protein [Bryobacteraceae bacterium]|nr:lytic transglycosylase domain-containing protein [Bryobacteraceae bacterium]